MVVAFIQMFNFLLILNGSIGGVSQSSLYCVTLAKFGTLYIPPKNKTKKTHTHNNQINKTNKNI